CRMGEAERGSGDASRARRSFLCLDAQQLGRLGAEALQLGVLLQALGHPNYGLVEPRPGLVLLAQLPVSHREDKAVVRIARIIGVAEADRFFSRSAIAPFQSPVR